MPNNNLKITGSIGVFTSLFLSILFIWTYIQILGYYPNFNPFFNYVSELGVGPNKIIFNLGIIISCIFIGIFFAGLLNMTAQEKKQRKLSFICLIIGLYTLFGLFIIGLFPMNDIGVSNRGHIIGAQIYWSGALIFWGLLAILVNMKPHYNLTIKYVVFLTFLAWTLFLSLFLIPYSNAQVDVRLPIIFQWIAHFFMILSIFTLSLKMIKNH